MTRRLGLQRSVCHEWLNTNDYRCGDAGNNFNKEILEILEMNPPRPGALKFSTGSYPATPDMLPWGQSRRKV